MTKKKGTGKAAKEEPKKIGRPTHFTDRLAQVLVALAAKNATDQEIAEAAGVALSTLYRWKGDYPDFREALKASKATADELVEASLYGNALAGNVTAQIFWLKNRQPDRWREKQEVQHKLVEPFVITRRNGDQVVLGAKTDEEEESA